MVLADLEAVKQRLCMKLDMFYLFIYFKVFSGRMVAKAAVTKVMQGAWGGLLPPFPLAPCDVSEADRASVPTQIRSCTANRFDFYLTVA